MDMNHSWCWRKAVPCPTQLLLGSSTCQKHLFMGTWSSSLFLFLFLITCSVVVAWAFKLKALFIFTFCIVLGLCLLIRYFFTLTLSVHAKLRVDWGREVICFGFLHHKVSQDNAWCKDRFSTLQHHDNSMFMFTAWNALSKAHRPLLNDTVATTERSKWWRFLWDACIGVFCTSALQALWPWK